MDAQKFGHSVGQFFKKIDRTLSFLPERPRKVAVRVSALVIAPLLALPIIVRSKTKLMPNDEPQQPTEVCKNKKEYGYLASPYSDAHNGYRDGYQGFGLYIHGEKQD